MDYSDIVFEDLIKYPELATIIFGKSAQILPMPSKTEIKLEPAQKIKTINIQESFINIKSEVKDNLVQNTQMSTITVKSEHFSVKEDSQNHNNAQQLPVILDSFSISKTEPMFLATENFNINKQSQLHVSSTKPKTSRNSSKQSQTSSLKCDKCGRTFISKVKLSWHMKTHEQRVKCQICNIFIKPYLLRDHNKAQHSAADEKFNCKICEKSFKRIKFLKLHESTHDKKFECQICNQKFSHNHELVTHVSNKHEKPNSFECKICGKKFSLKKSLPRHEKAHEGKKQKEHKCGECFSSFDDLQKLRKHVNRMHKKI